MPSLNMEPLNRYREKVRENRKQWILGGIIALLSIIVIAESVIIFTQRQVTQQIEAQSEEALGRFMKQGVPNRATQPGVDILFKNVRFCWSKAICISNRQLTATAISINRNSPVIFDNLDSIIIEVHNAQVLITPKTLQGMFNESVFNYPGSNLRDLNVSIQNISGQNHVLIRGSLNYILWLPFQMDSNLSVDRKTNSLIIAVNDISLFGFIPATWLIQLKPFNLDKILKLPKNRHLTVHHNLMLVKPFGLFPPPRVNGQMSAIDVTPNFIRLTFSGADPDFGTIPQPAYNLIYLHGGTARFGNIQMLKTNVEVIDQNPNNLFQFSLLNYLDYLPNSEAHLQKDGGAIVKMPDMTTLISSKAFERTVKSQPSPEQPSTFHSVEKTKTMVHKATAKVKGWFGF